MTRDRDLDALLDRLWRDYAALNPQAEAIHRLLEARGETVVNDHIALRTFGLEPIGIEACAAAFVAAGYGHAGDYRFPDKHLRACHYEHADPRRPRVFISELDVASLSAAARTIVQRLVASVPRDASARADFVASGRLWAPTLADYDRLRDESEYAAWLAAFGFRANHFTVSVNALESFDSLAALNDFLIEQGFELNDSGGIIKGGPEVMLEQSSTLASRVTVALADGRRDMPGCYYEFARRYVGADGALFGGFVAASANRIFESTDAR